MCSTPSLLWCQENGWSSALLFLLPVQVQEEGENTNSFTVTGTLTMKSEKETNLSLTIGEPLYPVRFHFYSSKVQAAENVSLTAGRMAGAASETLVELKQDKGQFAFDGKLTIDEAAGNHAYALAYLPAGNYRFVINTGITGLGSSEGNFTLDSETVKAEAAGTDIIAQLAKKTGKIAPAPLAGLAGKAVRFTGVTGKDEMEGKVTEFLRA